MNGFMIRINVNKNQGRHRILQLFFKTHFVNGLDVCFWQLPMGIKDTQFE